MSPSLSIEIPPMETVEDTATDTYVQLLQIYDGAKIIRSLKCTLKFKVFQHLVLGVSDSCIEIVALLSFHDNLKKDFELNRLFLSTKKIFSDFKKSLSVRVNIAKGNLRFIADYISIRIYASSDMRLQLLPFMIEKNGTRLESTIDVSYDGVKILAQLPHIENIMYVISLQICALMLN